MNPFKLTEPSCISFSGGRTSAYMLWRFIDANDGLPDDCIVTFANTGKEHEATLRFVDRCSKMWDVPIVWIEYKAAEKTEDRWQIVDFETAARNGEPFEAAINQYKALPNPASRYCTDKLKITPIARYLASLGVVEGVTAGTKFCIVGIRADEQRRAAKFEPHRRPLVAAGVTKEDVAAFWRQQPFDLELPNHNGVTPHGNCDLCYLKGNGLIKSLIEENPDSADWWAEQEEKKDRECQTGHTNYFRIDRPSYRAMQKMAREQGSLDLIPTETIPCFCGD